MELIHPWVQPELVRVLMSREQPRLVKEGIFVLCRNETMIQSNGLSETRQVVVVVCGRLGDTRMLRLLTQARPAAKLHGEFHGRQRSYELGSTVCRPIHALRHIQGDARNAVQGLACVCRKKSLIWFLCGAREKDRGTWQRGRQPGAAIAGTASCHDRKLASGSHWCAVPQQEYLLPTRPGTTTYPAAQAHERLR